MYAVQLFINRKYQTVTGPTSLEAAFDNYTAQVRTAAPADTMVRLVKLVKTPNGKCATWTLRNVKALALPLAAYFVPSTEVKNNPLPTAIKRLVPHSPKPKRVAAQGGKYLRRTARKAG